MDPFLDGAPGRYWHKLEDGRIQCDLCPRYCRLHDGQRGLCYVRARHDDSMVLTTYGRSSGFCIDPIEKKPLNHFLPGTPVLSFGTAGCNLTCKFCQNWSISKARALDRVQERASPGAIAEAAVASGCRSVGFTYNFYRNLCSGKLAPVLETLVYLKHETKVWFEITTLLIPGENDSPAEIEALCGWVMEHLGAEVPLHFTAFHPDWKMIDTTATPPDTLRMARHIGKKPGLRYVYTGNIHDPAGQSTYCHACDAPLIGRDWHNLTAWNLTTDGRCQSCGAACAGVLERTP